MRRTMMATYMDAETAASIDRIAQEEGRSRAYVMRELLGEAIEHRTADARAIPMEWIQTLGESVINLKVQSDRVDHYMSLIAAYVRDEVHHSGS